MRDKILATGGIGNLEVRIIDNKTNEGAQPIIKHFHVKELSDKAWQVDIDFNDDAGQPEGTCEVYCGSGWAGVDFMNDPDAENFSWLQVMFKWVGEGEQDLQFSWSCWDAGDEKESHYVCKLLVSQDAKQQDWDKGLTINL